MKLHLDRQLKASKHHKVFHLSLYSSSVCPFSVKVHLSNIISRVSSCWFTSSLILFYHFMMSMRVQHHQGSCCIIITILDHNTEMSLWHQPACWCHEHEVCSSRWQTFIGAALLLLAGKLGWVEISRIPRYIYCLTGSLSTDLFGKIWPCVADQQLFHGSLAPSCLRATFMLVPGPCHVWCVIYTDPGPTAQTMSFPHFDA